MAKKQGCKGVGDEQSQNEAFFFLIASKTLEAVLTTLQWNSDGFPSLILFPLVYISTGRTIVTVECGPLAWMSLS